MNIFRDMTRRRFKAKSRRNFLGDMTCEAFWTLYLLFLAILVWIFVGMVRAADARIYERLQ